MLDLVIEGAWSSIIIPSISRRVNGVIPPSKPFIILEVRKSGCVPPILPSISRSISVNEFIPGPFQDSTACSSERKECNCDRAKVLPGPHAILGSGLIKGKNSLDAFIAQ